MYVDDMVTAGDNHEEAESIKRKIIILEKGEFQFRGFFMSRALRKNILNC